MKMKQLLDGWCNDQAYWVKVIQVKPVGVFLRKAIAFYMTRLQGCAFNWRCAAGMACLMKLGVLVLIGQTDGPKRQQVIEYCKVSKEDACLSDNSRRVACLVIHGIKLPNFLQFKPTQALDLLLSVQMLFKLSPFHFIELVHGHELLDRILHALRRAVDEDDVALAYFSEVFD